MGHATVGRGGPPPRPGRVIKLAWLVVLGPLAVLLALSLASGREEHWLRPVAALTLPGIVHLEVGRDRLGDHAAVLDGRGQIHLLGLRDGRLTDQTLALPWAPRAQRTRLVFTAAAHDAPVDLVALRLPPRRETGDLDWGSGDWTTQTWRQQAGRFQPVKLPRQRVASGADADSRRLCAGGVVYRLQEVSVNGGDQTLTQLVREDDRRAGHCLEGAPYQVLDVDGDDHQDLLTTELVMHQGILTEERLHRLYVYRNGRFQLAWRATYQQTEAFRQARRDTVVADLDGDGRPEILAAEPATGRLAVWAFDPAFAET